MICHYKSQDGTLNEVVIEKNRIIVGSARHCDLVILNNSVSPIHCVIEFESDQDFTIFDLNSRKGLFVEGHREIVKKCSFEDNIVIGKVEISFSRREDEALPPPVDDSMSDGEETSVPELVIVPEGITEKSSEPVERSVPDLPTGTPSSVPDTPGREERESKALPTKHPAVENDKGEYAPVPAHPLSLREDLEFSEYIFEDAGRVDPVFSSKPLTPSVEITILFRDRVYTVDYIPKSNHSLYFVGRPGGGKGEQVFPYFGEKEQVEFLRFDGDDAYVTPIAGYSTLHIHGDKVDSYKPLEVNGSLEFADQDIVQFFHKDIKIFIRNSLGTPKVLTPPVFRRDKQLSKYFLFIFLILAGLLAAVTNFEVDEELQKERNPDRIATILYRQPIKPTKKKTIDKSKKVVKRQQKVKKKEIKTQKRSKPTSAKKEISKKSTKPKGIKTAKIKDIPKQKTSTRKMKTKVPKLARSKTSGGNSVSGKRMRRSKSISTKTKGHIDTYKRPNFKSSLSRVLSKGGVSRANVKVSNDSSTAGVTKSLVGGDSVTSLKTANVNNNVGSLNGSTRGRISVSKGSKGLSSKKTLLTAGIPSDTVVLGSMDPDIVRKILREHIPQFRYCYQRELDSNSRRVQGTVKLNFVIGASGAVTNASVESRLNRKIRGCVAKVLRGIQFPEPLGGGVVEVSQPINFFPKRI
jgi:hypothetical protein